MPRRKSTDYLTKEQMSKLSTPRLLAYRKSLLSLPEWRSHSTNLDYVRYYRINYARALKESKELLDKREHIPKRKKV